MTDFVGTSHHDRTRGGRDSDHIDVSQGGRDVVAGRQGDDFINFGATFTSQDRVNGGKDGSYGDTVALIGDYSAGVEFTADNLVNVESLYLEGGSFRITGVLVSGSEYGRPMEVSARQLGGHQTLDLDVAAPRGLDAAGGAGDDILRGSSDGAASHLMGIYGDDVLIGTGATEMVGGPGADRIVMTGTGDVAGYLLFENVGDGPIDTIENFTASGGRIELGFDSDTTMDGFQFDFHLGRTHERVGDVVSRYDATQDLTILRVFTDGDDTADFVAHLTGEVTFTREDFIFG